MTLDELVAAVQSQFDASAAQVQQWANDRQRRMVAKSLWRGVQKDVGSTVAGQAAYTVEQDMVDLQALMVDGVPYGEAAVEEMWALAAGTGRLVGDGVFAPSFTSAGVPQVQLYPVPSEAGLSITGLMAYEPVTMVSGDSPIIPVDLHPHLLDGVIADGYEQLDGRWDLATPHEQRFEQGIVELRSRRLSRIGGGPVRAQVAGYDF